MNGCGFCDKAKEMFKNDINSGKMSIQSSKNAQSDMKAAGLRAAFPTFKSMKTGKFHQGLPKSKSQLMQSLGHSEGYAPSMSSKTQGYGYESLDPLMGYKIDPAAFGFLKAGVL